MVVIRNGQYKAGPSHARRSAKTVTPKFRDWHSGCDGQRFDSDERRIKREPAQARARAGRVFPRNASSLPLLLFLLWRRFLAFLRWFFLGGLFGGFLFRLLRRRFFRSGFFCGGLRRRPRGRRLFLRLFLRNHQLFFLGLNDLFGITGELVILQRRHLVVFVKMIFIEIHAFLPRSEERRVGK